MSLKLDRAQQSDASRIAEIHMAAFDSNAMLHAQFPNPTALKGLQKYIEDKTKTQIEDSKTTVLVVRDFTCPDENGEAGIISFSKWTHPTKEGEDHVESPSEWPEGANREILDLWDKEMTEVQTGILGQRPCYHLSFIGTDPSYERRGAASMMLRWGMDVSKKERVPLYVESTLEAAAFYKNHGFEEKGSLSLQISAPNSDGTYNYKELAFIFNFQEQG